MASTFVENNFQSAPFCMDASASIEYSVSFDNSLWLCFARFAITLIASSLLPLLSSHLADSGNILKQYNNLSYNYK